MNTKEQYSKHWLKLKRMIWDLSMISVGQEDPLYKEGISEAIKILKDSAEKLRRKIED